MGEETKSLTDTEIEKSRQSDIEIEECNQKQRKRDTEKGERKREGKREREIKNDMDKKCLNDPDL